MFHNPSLVTRVAVGKLIGLIIGLSAFFLFPLMMPEAAPMQRWGILVWYITFGAIIGVFGVMVRMPVLGFAFPWWCRGALIGGWLNFAMALMAYDQLAGVMLAMFGEGGLFVSPFWIVAEGVMVGLIADYFATRCGGEGGKTATADIG